MSQDLSKGKIYKITNDYNDDVYVGSTCDTLVKRFSSHKSHINCVRVVNIPLYVLMREIGTDRFRIELIENYPCEDKYQLRQREGYFIRQFGNLNRQIAGRTKKENKEDNKEKLKEKTLEYRKENREQILEKQRNYYCSKIEDLKQKVMCECGCEITRYSINNHKNTKRHKKLMENLQR